MKDFIILSVLLPWLHPCLNIVSNFQKYFSLNAFSHQPFLTIFFVQVFANELPISDVLFKSLFSRVCSVTIYCGRLGPLGADTHIILDLISSQNIYKQFVYKQYLQKWLQLKWLKLNIKSVVKLFKLAGNGCRMIRNNGTWL